MKNRFLFASILISLLLFSVSCRKKATSILQKPEIFAKYVYAYSAGQVSKAAPIRLQLNSDFGAGKVGAEVAKDLFKIDPAVKGKAIWENASTIKFEPENHLEAAKTYNYTVDLQSIVSNVTAEARVFASSITVRPQDATVQMNGLQTTDVNDWSNMSASGTVLTADIAEPEEVEKTFKAAQNGQNLPIQWAHNANKIAHNFTVSGLKRKSAAAEAEFTWNGNATNMGKNATQKLAIPALGDFKVMNVTAFNESEPRIEIWFSDPIQAGQNIEDFISVNGEKARCTIEGNRVMVYPTKKGAGEQKVRIETAVKNAKGANLATAHEAFLQFQDTKPAVRFVGSGAILPNSEGLLLPFEAVNLNFVDVEVFKIFNNNILQYLQNNQINSTSRYQGELQFVGRVIAQKQLSLAELAPRARPDGWTRYALDLNKLIEADPQAIYQVRLAFRPTYTDYCQKEGKSNDITTGFLQDENEQPRSILNDQYWTNNVKYDWDNRENPCFDSYYNDEKFMSRNIFASDLGLVAKHGNDGSLMVSVADLKSTRPTSGVQLEIFDQQRQQISTATTNGDGWATFAKMPQNPYFVVATSGKQKGYLRLQDGDALSISRFDVGGTAAQKGLKGFLYGERGVWRPGDSLFLNFVLEDKTKKLPANFPITFELRDPNFATYTKFSTTYNVNNVYPLKIATNPTDKTGTWTAKVMVGGAAFEQNIKIETVKPNRLKVNLDFGKKELDASQDNIATNVASNWLTGAMASGLRANVTAQFTATPTRFPKYKDFEFDDPTRTFAAEPIVVFDKNLDGNGKANFNLKLPSTQGVAAGKLAASFNTRVFEQGGDFSSDNVTVPFHPYQAYAGVEIPKSKWGEKRLDLNKKSVINVVVVDKNGNPLANRTVQTNLYRLAQNWWYDESDQTLTNFNTSQNINIIEQQTLRTNGKGEAIFEVTMTDWGRYLVRATDEGGHATGETFYAGYSWDDGNAKKSASILNFTANKEKYNVGETVELHIPTIDNGRALVTLENGSRVVESHWLEAKGGETVYKFTATEAMSPNVFVNVSLTQPHAQTKNDLPIRLYGMIPILVEDPKTHLTPEIKMPDALEPNQTFALNISEKSGKACAYTVAVVDEGLLDLTRFKTPDPWAHFYAKEALGVKTWDVYDDVIGANGGALERVLSIGGDAAFNRNAKKNPLANRFKPVVKVLGPFMLAKGQKAVHNITLPNYVGSVKTMVTMSDNGAYGAAEKAVAVKKPVMVFATLPRVLSPTEKLSLPIEVFAMDEKVKEVTVTIQEASGLIDFGGNTTKTVNFAQTGSKMVNFDLNVADKLGIAKFKVIAKGGGETATQEIELDIRNPNPFVTNVQSVVLAGGQSQSFPVKLIGASGTNKAILEISNIPPLNLGKRLEYLLQYPHGCVEQTTSAAFPQLYADKLIQLNDEQRRHATENVKVAIESLRNFQNSYGGMGYWRGDNSVNHWVTNYAGHFLLEAKNMGYTMPVGLLDKWKKYQKDAAKKWDPAHDDSGSYGESAALNQAYRLYTLALAGDPETGAMNRLREQKGLGDAAKWRLAAAYALTGKPEIAKELMQQASLTARNYIELADTYGSTLRDQAMLLETLTLTGDKNAAVSTIQDISNALSSDNWYNTQATAYALMAVSKFVGNTGVNQNYNFNYKLGNQAVTNVTATRPVVQIQVPANQLIEGASIAINNTAKTPLFARLISSGQPAVGESVSGESNLKMSVAYKTLDGKPIDITTIKQGTDFVAEVSVTNTGSRAMDYEEMALTQAFPPCWEIHNARMTGVQSGVTASSPADYQDIRDDRVYTYFDLPRGKTHTYRVQLNAAYTGRYYLPMVGCEAMYDNTIAARATGKWVSVL